MNIEKAKKIVIEEIKPIADLIKLKHPGKKIKFDDEWDLTADLDFFVSDQKENLKLERAVRRLLMNNGYKRSYSSGETYFKKIIDEFKLTFMIDAYYIEHVKASTSKDYLQIWCTVKEISK